MRCTLILMQTMLRLYLRDRLTLFWNLVFPAFLLLIFGTIFGSTEGEKSSYHAWMLPGMIVLNVMAFGFIRSASTMVEWRQRGVLWRLHATPVSALSLVGSYMAVNLIVCLVQSAVLIWLAVLVYDVPMTLWSVGRAVAMIMAGVLTFVALGQSLSGMVTHFSAAIAIGQLVYYSQMFLGDVVLPLQRLPEWLQHLAPYLPAYAVAQMVRPALLGQPWGAELGTHLLVVMVYGSVAACVAIRLFRWQPPQ